MPPSPSFEHLTRSALHAHVGHLVHGGRPAVDDHELGAVSYGLAHDPQPGEYRQARARHQDDVAMAGGVHGLAHGGGQPLAEEDDVRLEPHASHVTGSKSQARAASLSASGVIATRAGSVSRG